MRTILLMWVAAYAAFAMSGCGPAPQPVWSQDSKTFFYTHSDGSVLQYDLVRHASRTLVEAGDQQPRVVGISPTLPFIAVPAASVGPHSRAATINLASTLTGANGWNEPSVFGDRDSMRELVPCGAYWFPNGRKVLIWYQSVTLENASGGLPLGRFAVYDAQTKKIAEPTTTPPAMILAQAANVSPISPDGSGYLAMKLNDSGPKFFAVTWDGWESPLALTEDVSAELNLMADKQRPEGERLASLFPLPQGMWEGQILKLPTARGEVQFDLQQRVVRLAPLDAARRKQIEEIRAIDESEAPWITVQATAFEGDRILLLARQRLRDVDRLARVELVDRQGARKRVLLEGRMPDTMPAHLLFPSPNRRLILAHLRDATGTKAEIHVIQQDGQILDKVDAGEPR